jgi:hypothetical protein
MNIPFCERLVFTGKKKKEIGRNAPAFLYIGERVCI